MAVEYKTITRLHLKLPYEVCAKPNTMFRIALLSAVIMLSTVFWSCKKEQTVVVPDPQPLQRMLVSSMHDLPGNKVMEFTYDASNRLVRWEGYDFQLGSNVFHYGTYHYENNVLRRMNYVNEFYTDIDLQTTFLTDASGRIDSLISWGIFARSSGKMAFDAQNRLTRFWDYGFRNPQWHYDYGNTANCVALRRDSAIVNFDYDQNRRPDWGLPAIYEAHANFLSILTTDANGRAIVASTNNVLQNVTSNHRWQYAYNANQYPDTIRIFRSGTLHSVWILEYIAAN